MSELSKLRLTVFPNGIASFLVDTNAEVYKQDHTLTINDDSGKTFVASEPDMTFFVPAIVTGNTMTFVNMNDDGEGALNISPVALDGINYLGSNTDDKDLINTKATSKKGDYVTLASLNGTTAWQVVAVRGIWAKE